MVRIIIFTGLTLAAFFYGYPYLATEAQGLSPSFLLRVLAFSALAILARKFLTPLFTYGETFVHEFTHAVAVWFFLGRVVGFRVGLRTGQVQYVGQFRSWQRVVIALSPYCIPLVPLFVAFFLWISSRWNPHLLSPLTQEMMLIASGVLYLQMLFHQWHGGQTDFKRLGRYCSGCCILMTNLGWLILGFHFLS